MDQRQFPDSGMHQQVEKASLREARKVEGLSDFKTPECKPSWEKTWTQQALPIF